MKNYKFLYVIIINLYNSNNGWIVIICKQYILYTLHRWRITFPTHFV